MDYELSHEDEQRLRAIYRDPRVLTAQQRLEYERSVARGEGEVEPAVQDNWPEASEVEVLRGVVYELRERLWDMERMNASLWFLFFLLLVVFIAAHVGGAN